MAYIVAEPCIKCKYTDCADICPVNCFYEGVNMLVIHPDQCIDCGACVDECPVEAIYPERELPDKWHDFIEINAKFCKEWLQIVDKQPELETASEYRSIQEKRHLLDTRSAEPY